MKLHFVKLQLAFTVKQVRKKKVSLQHVIQAGDAVIGVCKGEVQNVVCW